MTTLSTKYTFDHPPQDYKERSLPYAFWWLRGRIYGGPYRYKRTGFVGVKLAKEIPLPCDIDLPSQDFGTPDPEAMKAALEKVFLHRLAGDDVYAGCMGGIGRTGTFLAAWAKLCGEADPVGYVRTHYLSYAVETKGQLKLISDLDLYDLRRRCIRHLLRWTFLPWKRTAMLAALYGDDD